MKSKHRLALQLTIIGISLWLMVGCFYLPAKDKAINGSNLPKDLVGSPGSGKPLLVHQSTRDDASHLLANALTWSPDRRFAIYTYYVRGGYTVWPLCFYASPDTDEKYLLLRFTADGQLDGFDTFEDWRAATENTGITDRYPRPAYVSPRPTPSTPPLTPEQERQIRDRLAAQRHAETRPSNSINP